MSDKKPSSPAVKQLSFLKSGALISSMTFLSRIAGLVRDQVITIFFGASALTDAYYLAISIPNFLRRLFAEGSFSPAFVPVFTDYREKGSGGELSSLAAHVCGTLGGILLIVTLFGVLASPGIIAVIGFGFLDDELRFNAASDMLKITFPYLMLISLVGYSAGILNSLGRVAIPAITPILLNLVLIGFALFIAPEAEQPVMALAWGWFAAGVVQLLFQLPFLAQVNLLPRPRWGWHHPGVRQVLALMLPGIIGTSVSQINLLFGQFLASMLPAGSISWMYIANRLVEFPLGVFAVALGTIGLTRLSQEFSRGNEAGFNRTLDVCLRITCLIAAPAAVGLLLLARPLLSTIFQHGNFTIHSLNMSAATLEIMAIAVPAYMLTKVLNPGFHSRQNTKTPMRISIICLVANMVFMATMIVIMLKSEHPAPHTGLAMASCLSAWLHVCLLYFALTRRFQIYRPSSIWPSLLLKIALASAVMMLTLYSINPADARWDGWNILERAGVLCVVGGAGVLVYAGALWLLGLRPKQLRNT